MTNKMWLIMEGENAETAGKLEKNCQQFKRCKLTQEE